MDFIFRGATGLCAASLLALLLVLVVFMARGAWPALSAHGLGFIFSTAWDPSNEKYGALSFIYGTLFTSLIAILIALPLGVLTAVFLVEIAPKWLRGPIAMTVELLAAIPSVLLGLWGIFELVPLIRQFEDKVLSPKLGKLPMFSGPPIGFGYLAAGVLLAIMVLPLIVSVTREVLRQVPLSQREAAYALGATRWEVIRMAVLPYGWQGIFGAGMLALARALGETMAVTMVIGNTYAISGSLLGTGSTLASLIANEFAEAPSDLAIASLISLGLILFAVSFIVNALAQLMLRWLAAKRGAVSS